MRVYCFGCGADTIVSPRGQCSWCEEQIMQPPRHKSRYVIGHKSYIGTEEFYAECYQQYLEERSLRRVAIRVWKQAGYSSLKSCHNSLWEAFRARGWMLYTRSYTRTVHGLARRGRVDEAHKRRKRIERGEVHGVLCQAERRNHPRRGEPCGRPAMFGEEYCHAHHPKHEQWRRDHLAQIRRRKRDLEEAA